MIKVYIVTNNNRKEVIVPRTKTLREVLDENGVNYATNQVALNACVINGAALDDTFEAHDVADTCYLSAIVKHDNA